MDSEAEALLRRIAEGLAAAPDSRETALYYFYSTLAQVFATVFAVVGALGMYRLQRLREAIREVALAICSSTDAAGLRMSAAEEAWEKFARTCRKPWVDVAQALNMTVAGIVAHRSALKDGELLKIPQYAL